MKVLHLCLANFYIDNFSYQENLLPKYHRKMGYDVEIIASLYTFDKDGLGTFLDGPIIYNNEYDIQVTRLAYKEKKGSKRFRQYDGTYKAIEAAQPDIIFVHGCQFLDIEHVVEYRKKNPEVKIFVDNHADFSNSARNFLSKNLLHKFIWRRCARLIKPYTTKFYGVLPARVDFLKNVYKVPKDMVELLVMGADDDKVTEATSTEARLKVRNQYNIKDDDFLIVTGGKIDNAKRQVLNLMNVVAKLGDSKVKLIVYGSVVPEIQEQVNRLIKLIGIEYIGWINDDQSYKLFSAADLAVFPGRHSVYWEQVVAIGTPIVVKYWEGTTHVDIGGNCRFLYEDSEEELYRVLKEIIYTDNVYNGLLNSGKKGTKDQFLYSNIAKKSIDFNN